MRGQIGPTVEMITKDSSHQRSTSDVCQKFQKCRRKYGSDSTLVFMRKHVRTMRNISTKEAAEVMVDEYKEREGTCRVFSFQFLISFHNS